MLLPRRVNSGVTNQRQVFILLHGSRLQILLGVCASAQAPWYGGQKDCALEEQSSGYKRVNKWPLISFVSTVLLFALFLQVQRLPSLN